ncbi:double-stranded RNA-specific editase Adar isoform X1 [Drosophila innubila]|uniref:double-stranded RNA-specific editase Adar isoform X1 n=2 Tax=Drosophila innubila TaxID=198719 RepID=UPI00148DFBB7|nr:double-stranded RNA-specific editase Adar isoform X1 [Drosophila innubila]XP_034487741.1 double-stranded RNA-specific editase Adar isoform X1 [Drosophila innubila]XP_034487815.1 double-stranded RNA-specific editase Adar isoform X1 [Drosophila innubila]XP_034487889.1 double-stranded RNA-specific editase Adar isoform X1 [Drosophila innubila]XP_034487966.1 double-stranded RNA-specific editase Adar isoform X1 [Drosophila innubila]
MLNSANNNFVQHTVSVSTEGNMNGYNRKSPQKRRYDMPKYAVPPKKKSGKERVPQPKNTVAMLNELRHGLIYKLESQTGPVHAPLFTISVEVDGQKYMGQGRSKKVARIEAAATALRSFIQFKDGAVLSPLKPAGNLDFTSDEHLENGIENVSNTELVELIQTLMLPEKNSNPITSLEQSTLRPQIFCMSHNANKNAIAVDGQKKVPDKGPVMLLYELFNDVNFECMNIDGAQNNCRFKMTVTINDKKFDGTGPSKKLAKNAAAKAALASLCNISYSPMMAPQKNAPLPIDDKSSSMELPQIHADTIGRLVLEKFMEVIKGQEAYSRRKVLAGIVMTENMNFCEAKVISVSTGTKCVSGEHMSVNGAVLNDSHAEIVSRRCLLKYLYAQLDHQCNQATAYQSIFVRNTDGQYPYKLKSGVHFHLYINTAPCGDARIFSPHENDTGVDKHPNRKARGQLRTKIESGEGTIPVKSSDGIQTWDGVLQGQRLLTMSCSDKIARWNIVGIQGSLLSSIIEPVYLHSIVLGSLLHPEHMYRAVCGRIEKSIQGLPPPYHLNKPRLALVTSAEPRNQAKAPNFGINWTIGDTELEVVNSLTGRTIGGQVSRITKQAFFEKFGFLMKNLPGMPSRKVNKDYGETKADVKDYQTAKQELFSAFKREDLGSWLKKPIEQDQFGLAE